MQFLLPPLLKLRMELDRFKCFFSNNIEKNVTNGKKEGLFDIFPFNIYR